MRAIKFLLFLFCCILLQSCSLIKYGRSTTVTIESKVVGGPAHLLAIGQKKSYDYNNVTFPFEMKVRHKDIPLRLHAFSDDVDYDPMSINGKRVGDFESTLWKTFGWSFTSVAAILGTVFAVPGGGMEVSESVSFAVPWVVAGIGMIGLGSTTKFRVPEAKYYFFSGDTIKDFNKIMRSPQWKALQIRDDVYTLLEQESYELALTEIDYLFDKMPKPTPEMYFLKGASLYHLRKYKKSIENLHTALNSNDNPQELNEQIMSYIKAAEDGRAAQLEKRRQMWLDIAQTALQVTSTVLNAKQQYDASLKPTAGQSVGTGGSALDMELPEVFRPEYAVQFTQPEYTYDSNGNLMVSFPRWAEYEGQMNAAVQSQVASTAQQLMASGDSYYVDKAKSLQMVAKTHYWTTKLSQQFWRTPMYPEAYAGADFDDDDSDLPVEEQEVVDNGNDIAAESTDTSRQNEKQTSGTNTTKKNKKKEAKADNKKNKQQYRTGNVSSDDYEYVKKVTLYRRDGDKAKVVFRNQDLVKKGAQHYVLLQGKYYLVNYSNWGKFNRDIMYGTNALYFDF